MRYTPRIGLPLDAGLAGAVGDVVGLVGLPRFHDAVLDLLCTVCAVDSCGAMMFYRRQRPQRLAHRYNAAERVLPEHAYLEGPYVLDPHYQSFLGGAASGAYWLRDVAPDDFFDSEYHRVFYAQLGLSDSIDLMCRLDDDTALVYFVERSARNPVFAQADLAALELVLPMVFAAAQRHEALTRAGTARDSDTVTHLKVQRTIETFGRSLLTQREREVLFYMLSGYSCALTAERLKTSEGTIKVHRKNIYIKLDIGSQAELFSLFIRCIPYASPGDAGGDPLQAYQSKPAASIPRAPAMELAAARC